MVSWKLTKAKKVHCTGCRSWSFHLQLHRREVLATVWGADWWQLRCCAWAMLCLCLCAALSNSGGLTVLPQCCFFTSSKPLTHCMGSTSMCVLKQAKPFTCRLLLSPQGHLSYSLFSTPERHPNPCVKTEMKNWLAHVFTVEVGDFCARRLTVSLLLAWQASACCNPGTNQCHGCELASSFITLSSCFPSLLRKRSYLWTWTRWPPYGRFCHSPWGLELGTCSSGKAERHSQAVSTSKCMLLSKRQNICLRRDSNKM